MKLIFVLTGRITFSFAPQMQQQITLQYNTIGLRIALQFNWTREIRVTNYNVIKFEIVTQSDQYFVIVLELNWTSDLDRGLHWNLIEREILNYKLQRNIVTSRDLNYKLQCNLIATQIGNSDPVTTYFAIALEFNRTRDPDRELHRDN